MDAVEFIKEYRRMNKATKCEIVVLDERNDPARIIAEVEKWAKEHPVITRQNKILNLFPLMGAIEDGCIDICPLLFDRSFHDRNDRGWCTENDNKVCPECKRRFWMEELKEGET